MAQNLRECEITAVLEAEQALLGFLIAGGDACSGFQCVITRADVGSDGRRILYVAIESVRNAGEHIHPITLAQHLSRGGRLCLVGGIRYIAVLEDRARQVQSVARLMRHVFDAACEAALS
jgi:replicative DNA helicase